MNHLVRQVFERQENALALEREITWFNQVMHARFRNHFESEKQSDRVEDISPPDLRNNSSAYARIVNELDFKSDERIILILAMLPHIRPQALNLFFIHQKDSGRCYAEFGGWKGKNHAGFLPTCETAIFLLAGEDLERRFAVAHLFEAESVLSKKRLIKIDDATNGEPFLASLLNITTECLNLFTTGVSQKPNYGTDFPAKLITTQLNWDALVLSPEVKQEVDNLNTWLTQSKTLLQYWGLDKAVKPGYRCLFYGPPGTGKTLTATLIGAHAKVDVYRIDLSMVVSKYIGETEKNLAGVFDQAQDKNWILFFDEADALFGKRTEGSSSNDRHANQEISYLLQRVEDFPGVVILASNLKSNIDDAFARRFQSAVYFAMPDADQRLLLWQGMFQDQRRLGEDVNLKKLADKYELSGGAITNVARYAAIRATRLDRYQLTQDDLIKGIGKELIKEGRTL